MQADTIPMAWTRQKRDPLFATVKKHSRSTDLECHLAADVRPDSEIHGTTYNLEHFRKFRYNEIALVRILDRKLPFLCCQVVVDEYLAFLLSVADKDLHCRPVATRFPVEASIGCL
jgi:hypothetical protein